MQIGLEILQFSGPPHFLRHTVSITNNWFIVIIAAVYGHSLSYAVSREARVCAACQLSVSTICFAALARIVIFRMTARVPKAPFTLERFLAATYPAPDFILVKYLRFCLRFFVSAAHQARLWLPSGPRCRSPQ